MDLDLTEYDQVDEATFFINHKLGLDSQNPTSSSPLVVTLSSSSEQTTSGDDTNCENDFVFLPPAPSEEPSESVSNDNTPNQANNSGLSVKPDQRPTLPPCTKHPTSLPLFKQDDTCKKTNQQQPIWQQPVARASHPLMTINPNASSGKNPFYNLHQISPDSASSQAYQPFWMRPESFASKPIGLLEASSHNSCNPNHLSDLMHQIITKSDTIYIAIPCAYCQEPKACPPSDISAWLNHMNRAHNCKVCPVCNKLVGLGPMRDIEIMKKHVVSHIDDDWLERRSTKINFTFGLQQQWFSSGRCDVKDPRTIGVNCKS